MLAEAIRRATLELQAAAVPSPRPDAEALAAHCLRISRSELRLAVARGEQLRLPEQFADLIAERAHRVPLQHLTGVAEFAGVTLAVGPGVFVPRPETEVLVQAAVQAARVRDTAQLTIVDLCTGSAAIAIALAVALPSARVLAVELSDQALAWAERNIQALAPRVELISGDAATALPELGEQVDLVVSNPPYVPGQAVPCDPEVRDHDPALALYGGGSDGLDIPRAVIATAARLLRPGGTFMMEHAQGQQDSLARHLALGRWTAVRGHQDLNELPRFIEAQQGPDRIGSTAEPVAGSARMKQ